MDKRGGQHSFFSTGRKTVGFHLVYVVRMLDFQSSGPRFKSSYVLLAPPSEFGTTRGNEMSALN